MHFVIVVFFSIISFRSTSSQSAITFGFPLFIGNSIPFDPNFDFSFNNLFNF